MSEFNIAIPGGESKRLKTGGKFCPADIVVTAESDYGVGYEAGQKTEHDRFWDVFQHNGSRNDYTYAFARLDKTIFSPKYDIKGTVNASFYQFNGSDPEWESFDMVQHLNNLGVVLDTSASTVFTSTFMWARIGRLGVIDCTGTTNHVLNGTFSYGKIKTIDKLILKPEHVFTNTFLNNTELTNLTIEGTVGNSISFAQSSKLTTASVQSIIDHLLDLTGSTAKTLTLHTTVGAALTDTQKSAISAKNWTLAY